MGYLFWGIFEHGERMYWFEEEWLKLLGLVVEVGGVGFSEELLEELFLFAADVLAHQLL